MRVTAISDLNKTILGLAFILLVAGLLRLLWLADIPEGLWYDEAWVSIRARDVVALRTFPVYFEASFGGMHPAIVYLTVLARWLSGGHPLAIRHGVAVAGLLALLLAFWSFREIGRWQSAAGFSATQYALLSTFILAITFPFVIFNRIGFESMLPALPAALVFGGLARGLRTGLYRWYGLAGVALGLGLYTFDSARFLPVAFTVAVLGLLWRGQSRRSLLVGWVITAVTALILFAPLGLYFWQHWDQFMLRAGVASYNTLGPGADNVPLALLRNLGLTLGGLSLPGLGDQLPRHNIPGRPIYDTFLSLLLWTGVIVLLRRLRQPPATLLLAWTGVLLLPAILTDGAPTYTRILGAMPGLAGIAGWGGMWLYRRVGGWPEPAGRRVLLARLGLLLGLLFSLSVTSLDIFRVWPQQHGLDTFGVDDWQAAQAAREALAVGPVYVVPDLLHEGRPTFDLLLRDTAVQPTTGLNCLPYHPGQTQTYLIDTRVDDDLLSQLVARFPEGEIRSLLSEMVLFGLTAPAITQYESAVAFGPLQLLAYDVGSPTVDGLPVRLIWQAQTSPIPADYTIFLHLYLTGQTDAAPLAQRDSMPCAGGYPTTRWQAGEVVIDDHWLPLPEEATGDMVLALGLYAWPSLERLTLSETAATLPGNRLILGEIRLD